MFRILPLKRLQPVHLKIVSNAYWVHANLQLGIIVLVFIVKEGRDLQSRRQGGDEELISLW